MGYEMSGSTLVMAPVMDTSPSAFSRSHSTSELTSLSSLSSFRDTLDHHQPSQGDESDFDMPAFNDSFELDTTFSLPTPSPSPVGAATWRPSDPEAEVEARGRPSHQPPLRSRTGSLMERPRSWFPGGSKSLSTKDLSKQHRSRPSTSKGEVSKGEDGANNSRPGSSSGRGTAVQDSFANFAKRSFKSSSSSGSPAPKRRPSTAKNKSRPKNDSEVNDPKPLLRRRTDLAPERPEAQSRRSEPVMASKPFTRASSYFSKKTKKAISLSKPSNATDSDSMNSSAASLAPNSNSTEARNSLSTSRESNTTVTDDSSNDMPQPPKSKDPLWSSFKNLEVEFKTFAFKMTSQRILQVQHTLLPFLRSTMDHSSTRELCSEDLDRRANILNKWWVGILDMMDGTGLASVPGVDRPVLFDALTDIMMRPEWRQTTTYFLPLSERCPRERVRNRSLTNASASTAGSEQAMFSAESAEHSVRTMFISNLAKQLGFAVEKMGMRYAPQALVEFAGKTCAYAFFFVPGVPDILIRLWGMGPDLIRRASDEMGLPRKSKGESDDIVALFPPKLAAFGWTSSQAMWNTLKQIPKMPVMISQIPWTGPWISRWKGRDTDLVFVFYKQFHILTDNFMPSDLPLTEKARAPGFAVVHAQLLSIIDDTIHRQSQIGGTGVLDPMPGVDASAMAMPLPPPNLMKGMFENSLVMLLRDMLLDKTPELAGARHTFAESCMSMIQAAVRRTSQFDNAACFTLCDFLEEALTIYDNFEAKIIPKSYVDWPFWMDVFERILASLNTMCEVRVLSFVYQIWDIVTEDPARKAAICMHWLLTEETFNTYFNHWCPMVRAYYQRLLCWRICRCEGDADDIDTTIFLTVAARLKTKWSHYLYLKEQAYQNGRFPPSTAPMVPTPGKKFMIIRQAISQPQPGLLANFDSYSSPPGSDVVEGEDIFEAQPVKSESKKKWSLLGKVLTLGTGNAAAPKEHGRKSSWDEDFANARRETAESRSRASQPQNGTSNGRQETDSTCSSPVYEEQKYVFKFFLAWHQPALPPRDRILTRPRLPAPAQAIVSMHAHSRAETASIASGSSSSSSETADQHKDSVEQIKGREVEAVTEPAKPMGIYARNAVYSGRSLAEWALVMSECNHFTDRRREDGVPGLHEVEVPMLGVETFRKPGG